MSDRPDQLPHTNGRFDHAGSGVQVPIPGSKNGSFQWGLAKIGVSKWQLVMGFDAGFGVLVLIAGSKTGSFQWGLGKIRDSKWQLVMGFGAKNDRCAASPRHLPSNAERYLYIIVIW